jgi:serine/threonine protein kinase/tetratricopeptide (TPR) repeat protein
MGMNEMQQQTATGVPGSPAPAIPVTGAQEDARLVEALDDYLAGVEEGREPDRHDFLARYADIAHTLSKCLEGFDFVQQAGSQLNAASGAGVEVSGALADQIQPEGPLGDYRLVREIGRGGMGVVYDAVQISLGRRVAVKVLPFAAALDSKQLQRFKNEAQAAAHLHHQNIVPVYGVGCERGVHFYAMQFIDGQPLTAVLCELRKGVGFTARELSGSAAGVSSPGGDDLVPAERPSSASGPASLEKSAAEQAIPMDSAARLSHEPTARLVATVATGGSTTSRTFFRSMAQLGVQAAEALEHAHQMGVVHRDIKPANLLVDVHGKLWVTDFGLAHLQNNPGMTISGDLLGTIRYMSPEQALGKRAPVDPRSDVYSLGVTLYEMLTLQPAYDGRDRQEVLHQIAFEVPRSPRRLNAALPGELETIVLKAMGKSPEDRYASAQEVADDLRRFLEDKPILARRPRLRERATKWAWRHKPMLATAASVLILAVLALALCTLLVWQEKERTLRALAEAEKQGGRAEENFQIALAAVEQMLTRVSDDSDRLAYEPGMELVRRKLLEDALRFYKSLLKEKETDPVVRRETATTYLRIGDLQDRLGQQAAANEAYRAGMVLFQALADEFPQQPIYRYRLAACYGKLGNLLVDTPNLHDAERAFRQALDIQQALVEEFPGSAKYRSDLAGSYHNLGVLMRLTERLPEAVQALRRALDHKQRLAEQFPEELIYQQGLAKTHNSLGILLDTMDRPEEAEQACRQGLALQRRLVEKSPRMPAYRQELAGSHNVLASLLAKAKRFHEAQSEYGQAVALQRKLAEESPHVPLCRQELANTHYNLAQVLEQMQQPREAEQAYRTAGDLQRQLVDEFPRVHAYHSELADTVSLLARLQIQQGRFAEARQNSEQAVRHQLAALQLYPGQRAFARSLGSRYEALAETLVLLGEHAAAAQATAELPVCFPANASKFRRAAGLLARCVPLAQQDQTVPMEKRDSLAKTYGDQAMLLLKKGLQQKPGYDAELLKKDTDLASIRSRPDFQELVREVERASAAAAKE